MDFSILTSDFLGQTFEGLVVGAIYALVALGYTLVYGVLRLINFAHSEIFMIGTFSCLGMTMILGFSTDMVPLSFGLFFLVFILISVVAGLVCGASAMLLEVVAYRRLRKKNASRLSSLISAIGASFFLIEVFRIMTQSTDWAFPRLVENTVLFQIGTAYIDQTKLFILVGAIIMMVGLDQLVQKTKLGRGIRSVSQDERTAVLMGVDVNKVIGFTFLIGGILAGFASSFYLLAYESTKFNVGFLLGVAAFTSAVLGGIGNVRGALAGAFALGLIQQYASSVIGYNWRDVVAFVVLVIVLLFKPTGIFGESLQKARV
jgi:branched-chain amino acid transport system permease protein